jgi:integrase
MTPRKRKSRIYWRAGRAWGDFRDYADAGGRREPLIAEGERVGTTDDATAQILAARRVAELESLRRGRAVYGIARQSTLNQFAASHLIEKARSGKVTERWLVATERQLERACRFFGATRTLDAITVSDVQRWLTWLRTLPGRKGETMTGGTLRHHLNALSNLYRRAQAEGAVLPGFNPVMALMEKPSARRREAEWLEVHEAALLLEAARTTRPKREDLATPFLYPMLATFLLTGGRRSEVLGLMAEDVSFDRRTVTFRENDYRRLKTGTSFRSVPMWPQLAEILQPYVFGPDRPPGRLLFPSFAAGREAMLTDFRKALDRVSIRAGWKAGEITPKMFRHTYCAARLATVDRGAPVSTYHVGRELGHGGASLVQRVYGHLGTVRARGEVVEYRVEAFREELGERLTALEGAHFGRV